MMFGGAFGASGAEVVIEEFMAGEEASFFALCDGEHALPLATAQDHKAAYDGDNGPNTGGMGAYSPAPVMTDALCQRVMDEMIYPTLRALTAMGTPYKGVLFAGIMVTKDGPKLVEYNARFGDPETPGADAADEVRRAAGADRLRRRPAQAFRLALVRRRRDHRDHGNQGLSRRLRQGLGDQGSRQGQSGRRRRDLPCRHEAQLAADILANGGRVLNICASAKTVVEARERAYRAVDLIDWPEGFCRRDIGWRAVERETGKTSS